MITLTYSQLRLPTSTERVQWDMWIEDFENHFGRLPDESTPLRKWMDAKIISDIPDLLRVMRAVRPSEVGRKLVIETALAAVERALPIFGAAVPGDLRPRAALELAQKWAESPHTVSRDSLKASADAAHTAANRTDGPASAAAWAAEQIARSARAYSLDIEVFADRAALACYHAANASPDYKAERALQLADFRRILTEIESSMQEPP